MLLARKRVSPYNEKQRDDTTGTVYYWSVGKPVCEVPDEFGKFLLAECPLDYEIWSSPIADCKTTTPVIIGKELGDYTDAEIEAELNRRGRCSRKKRGVF